MKLVVPLTIPWTRSIGAPASDSWSTRITGTTPGDGALEAQLHALASRATSHSSSPCWESSCLLAVTTCRAGAHRAQHVVARRLDPADQLDDQIRALEDLVERARASGSARPRSRPQPGDPLDPVGVPRQQLGERGADGAVAEQPDPERSAAPISVERRRRGHQVLVGLAPHDDPRVAVAAEDHRRARHAVVVVGQRVAVGAGRRRRRARRPGAGSGSSASRTITSPDSQCLPARWQRSVAGASGAVGDHRLVDASRTASAAGCPTSRRRPRPRSRRCA